MENVKKKKKLQNLTEEKNKISSTFGVTEIFHEKASGAQKKINEENLKK